MATQFCPHCGTRQRVAGTFCHECGQPVADVSMKVVDTDNRVVGAAVPVSGGASLVGAPPPMPIPVSLRTVGQQAAAVGALGVNGLNINVNVSATMATGAGSVVLLRQNEQGIPLLLRALWFLFAGWYLGLVWSLVAWIFNATIIGLPLGLTMINALPYVMTLRQRTRTTVVQQVGNTTVVHTLGRPQQMPFLLRAAYFVTIGWWFSLIWLLCAWLAAATLIGLPLTFWMVDRIPLITTLALY